MQISNTWTATLALGRGHLRGEGILGLELRSQLLSAPDILWRRNQILATVNGRDVLSLRRQRTHSGLVFVHHPLKVLLLLVQVFLLMTLNLFLHQQGLFLTQLSTTIHCHPCCDFLLYCHTLLDSGLLVLEEAGLWLGKLVLFLCDPFRSGYLHAGSSTWPGQNIPLKLLMDRLSDRRITVRVEVFLRLHRIAVQLG